MKAFGSLTRRQLLAALPAGTGCLGCLGARTCAAQNAASLKSGEKADMTWEQVFDFAYGEGIPVMKRMAEQIGRTKFLEILRKAGEGAAAEAVSAMAVAPEKRDLAAWVAPIKKKSPLMEHALVLQVVKDTPSEFAMKVTDCLWARTFRVKGAADIGYAMICHPDFAAIAAFNPKLKMVRTKTLMQGADSCDHRYIAIA